MNLPRYTSPVRPIAARQGHAPSADPGMLAAGLVPTMWTVALPCDMRPIRRVFAHIHGAHRCMVGADTVMLDTSPGHLICLSAVPLPRLDGRADFSVPGARIVARWEAHKVGTGAAWALGVRINGRTVRVAGGRGFRPAPRMVAECGKGSRAVGAELVYMAFQALPGSGSGIAGDADSLAAWTPEGVTMCDLPAWHDTVNTLAPE